MKTVIGVDIGASLTKAVINRDGRIVASLCDLSAADPTVSLQSTVGRITSESGIALSEVEAIRLTGVGSSRIKSSPSLPPAKTVGEFDCVACGGLFLSGLSEAIVISLGTGSALVHAKKTENGYEMTYLGGTGVGGGTLIGLSGLLLGTTDIGQIAALAEKGDLSKIDLRISDVASPETLIGLPAEMTVANFGKAPTNASPVDIALAVLNTVLEVPASLGLLAARGAKIKDVVLTGSLAALSQAKPIFASLSAQLGVNYIVPDCPRFAVAIGATLI